MNWRSVSLGQVGTIVGGGTPSTSNSKHFGDTYPWITPKDLSKQRSRFVRTGERGITDSGLRESSAKLLPAGTVILSSRAPIGLTAIAVVPLTTNQGCRSFVPGAEVDSLFIYYLFGSMKDEFERRSNGSTFKEISGSTLSALEVLLPPLNDQREIAATLGVLDDKIDSNRRAIDLAEQLADQVFAVKVADRVALTDVAMLTMGSSPPGDTYNLDGVGLPFYQGVRDFGRRYPGHRVWTTGPVRLAYDNDSLVSVRAPVGKLNRSPEACCIGRGVAAVSSRFPSCIYYALRASDASWEPFQHEGTVFGAINKSDLSNARLPWPASDALDALETQLSAIDDKILSLSKEIEELTSLRDTLLPELLSGRLQVGEAKGVLL